MNSPMNFAKTFWAALLAFLVANIVLAILSFFFFAMMIAAMTLSLGVTDRYAANVTSNSILKIDLAGAIVDEPPLSPFGMIDLENMRRKEINTILQAVDAIDHAALDDRISGIFLELGDGAINLANLEELRGAILRFKENSGKFVISYGNQYSQRDYYFCSVADRIYMNPQGLILWQGMASNILFYKGLIDKLGIEAQVLRHGTFKAAVEPFMQEKMSPENRLQMNSLLSAIWENVVSEVAESRGMEADRLQKYASELSIAQPEDAIKLKLLDELLYRDQVISKINEEIGGDEDDGEPNFVSLPDYIRTMKLQAKFHKDRIAVIYAEGNIVEGESAQGLVGSVSLAEKLDRVRNDNTVKGVVLRINSPGGSALASEVIWREMERLREKKTLVVSMGGVAASGGYYMAAPADIIVADKTTITGSIGAFGLMFNVEKGLRDKLGITVDVARTNPSADMGSPFRPFSARERAYIMGQIERVYDTFVGHVAAGRNMTREAVDKIGEGRVWSASDALKIGLIDGYGGIKEAITLAADRAGVAETYSVYQVPDKNQSFFAIYRSLAETGKNQLLQKELGNAFEYCRSVRSVLSQQGVQARLPYHIEIE